MKTEPRQINRIRRVQDSGPLKDKLVIGEYTVAAISGGVVSPTHGYYPPHPYARRVKSWAKRHGLPAPLY